MTLKEYIENELKGVIHYSITPHIISTNKVKYESKVYFTTFNDIHNKRDKEFILNTFSDGKLITFNEYFLSDDLDYAMFQCEEFLKRDYDDVLYWEDKDIEHIASIEYLCTSLKKGE